MLVRDVSIYYYAQVNAISAGQVSLDFNSTFGGHIEAFHNRKSQITDAMWRYKLGDDASMDVETLRAWLRPHDRNLQMLVKNRLHAPGHRDEYTCEWFQRHLLDFSRSEEDGLEIVGPAGCGKSVLSRWINERLQRPLGKRTYETLFLTIGRLPFSAWLPPFCQIHGHHLSKASPNFVSGILVNCARAVALLLLHSYSYLHSCDLHSEPLTPVY